MTHQPIYLDSWSSWRIREWIECYPKAPIPASVLVTLLVTPTLRINQETFWPESLDSQNGGFKEFREFVDQGHLEFFAPHFSRLSHLRVLQTLDSGPEKDDFSSLLFADRDQGQLVASPQTKSDFDTVVNACNEFYFHEEKGGIGSGTFPEESAVSGDYDYTRSGSVDISDKSITDAFTLALQVETPLVYSEPVTDFEGYNEFYYSHLFEYGNVRLKGAKRSQVGRYRTGKEVSGNAPIFISPEEVLELLKKGRSVQSEIRRLISDIVENEVSTIDEMHEYAQFLWTSKFKTDKIGDWVFKGIDVLSLAAGMSGIPEVQAAGLATEIAAFPAESLFKRRSTSASGLLVLQDLNRHRAERRVD